MMIKKFKNTKRILKPKDEEDVQKAIETKIQSSPQHALKEFVSKIIPKGIEVFLSDPQRTIFIDTCTIHDIRIIPSYNWGSANNDLQHSNIKNEERVDFVVGSEYSIFLLVYIGILYSSKILDYLYSYFPKQTKIAYDLLNYKYDIHKISLFIEDGLYNKKTVDMRSSENITGGGFEWHSTGVRVTNPPQQFISNNMTPF